MTIFGFTTRAPRRDRESDSARFQRLLKTITEVLREMERESAGLQARYRKATDDAAFSFQALENGDSRGMSLRVEELTGAMARYEARVASLRKQIEFMNTWHDAVASYLDTPDGEKWDGGGVAKG